MELREPSLQVDRVHELDDALRAARDCLLVGIDMLEKVHLALRGTDGSCDADSLLREAATGRSPSASRGSQLTHKFTHT